MEEQRRIYERFLSMHAQKAQTTQDPVAHLQFWRGVDAPIAHDAPLIALTREEVLSELDPDSELVRWLLQQMSTYDSTRQRIVGLVFDKRTVLSDVLREPAAEREARKAASAR